MRIAWFTPFDKESAIGRSSRLVVGELARSVDVDIWHPGAKSLHETSVRTIAYSPTSPIASTSLDAYDLAVYNFGNDLENHRQIFEISRRTPGINIIHDFVLHNFFARYYLEYHRAPDKYIQLMERWYGDSGGTVARASSGAHAACPIWLSDDVVRYPLFEEASQGAYGVVAHSDFLAGKIKSIFHGPVSHLRPVHDSPVPRRVPSRESLEVPEGKVLLVTIGRVNRNQRIGQIIEVLGKHAQLASRVLFVVLGPSDPVYLEELTRTVRTFDLSSAVRFTGALSGEPREAFLAHADISVDLRCPAFEAASAIEELFHGKAVIVSDSGCYREFPQGCVWKVPPENEAEVFAALSRLVEDEPFRRRLGESGREYARNAFRADRYATGVLELASEVLHARPLLAYADRVALEMARMGLSPEAPLVSTVSEMSAELFGDA